MKNYSWPRCYRFGRCIRVPSLLHSTCFHLQMNFLASWMRWVGSDLGNIKDNVEEMWNFHEMSDWFKVNILSFRTGSRRISSLWIEIPWNIFNWTKKFRGFVPLFPPFFCSISSQLFFKLIINPSSGETRRVWIWNVTREIESFDYWNFCACLSWICNVNLPIQRKSIIRWRCKSFKKIVRDSKLRS